MTAAQSNMLAQCWQPGTVLKRDVFSTIEQGKLHTPQGVVDAVLRHTHEVPWWSWPLARLLLWRERRALMIVGPLGLAPRLLMTGSGFLVRSWVDGATLQIDHPHNDAQFFSSAKTLLRKLHRAAVCHNDLAKRPNWLRGHDGRAHLVDFQLAIHFRRRHKLFRIAAYEDLRHLLKYKRLFAPQLMTPTERRIVVRKSLPARIWMVTGKPVYMFVTRRLMHYADREGGGPRLVYDAPRLAALIKSHPLVREVAIVAYPDRRSGVALQAFIEANSGLNEQDVRDTLGVAGAPRPPERVQLVEALPRDTSGAVRIQLLQLAALDQADQVNRLVVGETEREIMARIMGSRQPASQTAS